MQQTWDTALCDISLASTSIFCFPSELPRPDLFALIREGVVGLGPQGLFSAKHVGSVGACAWKRCYVEISLLSRWLRVKLLSRTQGEQMEMEGGGNDPEMSQNSAVPSCKEEAAVALQTSTDLTETRGRDEVGDKQQRHDFLDSHIYNL